MRKLGKKRLTLHLTEPVSALPDSLAGYDLQLGADGREVVYTYDTKRERTGITGLLTALAGAGIGFTDLDTKQSSLEEIFVDLVRGSAGATP